MRPSRGYWAALLLLAALIIASAFVQPFGFEKTTMQPPSSQTEGLFKEIRTICLGRFLLDIPSSATVVFGRADTPFQTYRYRGEAKNIDKVVAGFLSDLARQNDRVFGDLLKADSMLGKVIENRSGNQKVIFDLSPGAGDEYRIKSLTKVGEDLFLQYADTFADRDYYSQDLRELNDSAIRLVPRAENAIPVESGFCIDGALVRDTEQYDVERIQAGIRLKEFPDVHFSIEMVRKSEKVESDALEPRLKEAEREARDMGMGAWYQNIRTLRRGERVLPPWSGYEVLARLPPQKLEGESHQFNFVALGEPKNAFIPTIDMSLDTGVENNRPGQVRPSVTDDEAVYIWDKLTSSLRVRPVGETAKPPRK